MIRFRELVAQDADILDDFLYLAIHQTGVNQPVPRSITRSPEVAIYAQDWGRPGDAGYVAISEAAQAGGTLGPSEAVGAAWARILSGQPAGYGNVDTRTPEFSISVKREYRGRGVGAELLQKLISRVAAMGYEQASLSVQKSNPAHRLYRNMGFTVYEDRGDSWVMVIKL